MSRAPSLAGRAVAAVLLMIGFYLLAFAIAGALLWVVYAEVALAHRVNLRLTLVCVAGAGIILWSVLPRSERFAAPGPLLEPARHPRLFDLIRDVARATGQAEPEEVYLCPDVNAWVSSRGGTMGAGSRRIMGLGLPLLQTLTVPELRAVLAHEFGHYHGGDVALGPWIHETRAAIGRTLAALEHHSGLLQKPFHWYGLGFLRVTHAISRAQEYAADALACRVAGAGPMRSGLRRMAGVAAAYDPFWSSEFEPALASGFRVPWVAGFEAFLATAHVEQAVARVIEAELKEGRTDAYDTHPPLRERLAALEGPDGAESSSGAPAALTLLEDVPGLERRLLDHVVVDELAAKLVDLPWEDVGTRVIAPHYRTSLERNRPALANTCFGALPEVARDLTGFARCLAVPTSGADPEDLRHHARWVLGAALCVALERRGGTVRSLPGEPVRVETEQGVVDPFAWAQELGTDALDPAEWRARCRTFGIEDDRLIPPKE